MHKRIAVYGATDAALELLPALARRGDLALAIVYEREARALRRRLALIEPGAARLLQAVLTDDLEAFARTSAVAFWIDGGLRPALREQVPALTAIPESEVLSATAASQRLGLVPSAWREPAAPARRRDSPSPALCPAAFDPCVDAAIGTRQPFVLLRCAGVTPGDRAADADSVRIAIRDRVAASLRAAVTTDDALADVAEVADGSVFALWIHPHGAPAERRVAQARAAAEAIAETLRDASPRPALAIGYALYPEDGADRQTLLARAGIPRIRML